MQGIFHAHSVYSNDGKLTLKELKEECIHRNLHFLLLTEHAEDFDLNIMQDFVSACHAISDDKFFAIPGLEFSLDNDKETHLLVCGLTDLPPANDIQTIAKFAEKKGGVLVIAHPCRINYYVSTEIIEKIDGIEVWNASYDSRYLPNNRSYNLLNRSRVINPNLLGFGGLDLHGLNGFKNVTISITENCSNGKELLDSFKRGKFFIQNSFLTIRPDTEFGILRLSLLALFRLILNAADKILWSLKGLRNSIYKKQF